jgi:glycosyltransferase involved in cell wall biosynthesis
VRWSVFGGGDAALLARLRSLPGVRVRGFYRPGTLPRRLRAAGVDLALLLSPCPESYSLTLEECAAAGVPVLAFDHGAVAEKIRRRGGGDLVALAGGVDALDALVARVAALLAGAEPLPPATAPAALTGGEAAAAWLALYRELGIAAGEA